MSEFTFLSSDQVYGSNQLDIMKRYGTRCAITDFSILLGGKVSSKYTTSEGNTGKDRAGLWWTKTPDLTDRAYYVADCGRADGYCVLDWASCYSHITGIGARPAIPYSLIQPKVSNGAIGKGGILEVEYCEYPQTVDCENYACELERAYRNGSLRITGKKYTAEPVGNVLWLKPFCPEGRSLRPRTYIEYEYEGSKHIRYVGDLMGRDLKGGVLSDGRTIQSGNIYWVRVEPIIWLVDEKADIALAKNILFSGVTFLEEYGPPWITKPSRPGWGCTWNGDFYHVYVERTAYDYSDGDFNRTTIKKFMDDFFSKEIVPDSVYLQNTSTEQLQNIGENEPIKNKNSDIFNFKVTKSLLKKINIIADENLFSMMFNYVIRNKGLSDEELNILKNRWHILEKNVKTMKLEKTKIITNLLNI
jgi:hypothetical protein